MIMDAEVTADSRQEVSLEYYPDFALYVAKPAAEAVLITIVIIYWVVQFSFAQRVRPLKLRNIGV